MPTVKLRFPGGRYHATPWGHHVNEGLIEWPPSPWRLLRALLACGFSTQSWNEVPAIARRLIEKLAAVHPSYQLPTASAAHSRHFMPIGVLTKGREQTTLVFDTWANVGDGELLIHWPCELDADEGELFGKLVSHLGYLGRSESWVEAEIGGETSVEWIASPCVEHERRGPGWEQVSLMAPVSPTGYEQWRTAEVQEVLRPFQDQKPTASLKKKQEQALLPYPVDLISCLTKDTAWWKGLGWSQPPGAQRVLYWRRSDALEVGVPIKPRPGTAATVQCMLLSLTTPSGNRSPLPLITRTLPQAEIVHQSIVRHAANGDRIDCPSLTGRDHLGRPLNTGHQHAHTIPLDLDGDRHIDHVLIYAPTGLCAFAQAAIRRVRRTWMKGGVGELRVGVVGSGPLEILRQLRHPWNLSIEGLLGPKEGSCFWKSVCPFVPPRHLKKRGKDTLENQIQAELASRSLPPAERVVVDSILTKDLRHFVRQRNRANVVPKMELGFGIRLQLAEPISGPLLLGYASHFGLGQFCSQNP